MVFSIKEIEELAEEIRIWTEHFPECTQNGIKMSATGIATFKQDNTKIKYINNFLEIYTEEMQAAFCFTQ